MTMITTYNGLRVHALSHNSQVHATLAVAAAIKDLAAALAPQEETKPMAGTMIHRKPVPHACDAPWDQGSGSIWRCDCGRHWMFEGETPYSERHWLPIADGDVQRLLDAIADDEAQR